MRRAAVLAVVALAVAGCSGSTGLPDQVRVDPPTTVATTPPQFPICADAEAKEDATRSYAPPPAADATVAAIKKRGRLIVGVSADTLLFGARNPFTGAIEGFDVDILKEVVKAIFGADAAVDEHIEYRVLTYAQRLPALEAGPDNGGVDIVAHTMTINCNRWKRIAFSSEYYTAGQKVLVKKGSGVKDVEDLVAFHARVCAPAGSTNIDEIRKPEYTENGISVIERSDVTDCLVAMQQGEADAATGDDTVLAGFVAQDPNTEVVGAPLTKEPYGLGMAKEAVDFVQFVNGVLEQVRSSGRWAAIYKVWLNDTGALPNASPTPPPAVYGRAVP